jgi:hypothetical protein
MCVSCVSNVEALALSSVAALTGFRSGWGHLKARLKGQLPERRRQDYQRTADYLASMGHDPRDVLGPPPDLDPTDQPSVEGTSVLESRRTIG